MKRMARKALAIGALSAIAGCGDGLARSGGQEDSSLLPGSLPPLALTTNEILVTNEAGDRMALRPNVAFTEGAVEGVVVEVNPAETKQTLLGVGTSFTESSAFVLAHLDDRKRMDVMRNIYSNEGANFPIARTPIGSTDFSVEGKYSYAPVEGDSTLEHFSIAPDNEGFSRSAYPGVKNESYDVLPMIKEAQAIKADQASTELRIVASAWTAPPWMKTIDTWYVKPTPDNNWQGTGGQLKPEHVATYADYLIRYLDAYEQEGVKIWGLTPVNEPNGNSGQWESMHFTPRSQSEFVKKHLGPKLRDSKHASVKLLVYDQNRDHLEEWVEALFGDEDTAQYVSGVAVHWYSSTYKVYEDVFDSVHARYPKHSIIHTEGTIDDLGKKAPGGVIDTEKFEEKNWFKNDEFWWNANATDWAYSATWAPNSEDHPIYTAVHRYARDIIVGFNHWLEGWIDWNIVLDANGGPNHVGNFCGAPIMIDTATGEVYYTPIFYVLAQLSRTIRPGDVAVQANVALDGLDDDALHASASLNADGLLSVQMLNTTKLPIELSLKIGDKHARIKLDANALQTVRVSLSER